MRKDVPVSQFLDSMIARAKADKKTIVLPEGNDIRTLKAAEAILAEGIADLIVLGDADDITAAGCNLEGARIVDFRTSELREPYAEKLAELRAAKGMTLEQALELMDNELYFGMMMVKMGEADGLVSGACHSTGDVLRPALQILKTAPGAQMVSSFFVMNVPDCDLGHHGTFIFSDCGLEVQPDADRLAQIAINAEAGVAVAVRRCRAGHRHAVAFLLRLGQKRRFRQGGARDGQGEGARARTRGRRRAAAGRRHRSRDRRGEGAGLSCRGSRQRTRVPGHRCGQHRLQAGAALGEGRGARPHPAGYRRSR